MKNFFLVSLLLVGSCAVSQAAPCVAGSLFSYAALGSTGCEVSAVNFSYFDLLVSTVVNANNITSADITVTPTSGVNGPNLDFSANWAANSGLASSYTATLVFRAQSTAPLYLTGSNLATDVAHVGALGVATVAEVNCLGGLLGGGSACLAGGVTANGVATSSLATTQLSAAITPFNFPVTMIDVIKNITLTGGIGSNASLGHITEGFTTETQAQATPEPSTMILLSSAVIALACFRRMRKI